MKYLILFIILLTSLKSIGQSDFKWRAVGVNDFEHERQQIEKYTQAILYGEDSLRYVFYYKRAFNKKLMEDFDGALFDLNKSIELKKRNCSATRLKADIYFETGKRIEACELWSSANEICPNLAEEEILVHCDNNWDYSKEIVGWTQDSSLFRRSIYSNDTSYYPNWNWLERGNDYKIFFDDKMTRLYKQSYAVNDTVFVLENYSNGNRKLLSKEYRGVWVYSKTWHSNGNVKMEGHNPNSLELQTLIQYRENGNVFVKSQQENHLMQGEFFSFYENGNPMEYGYYKDNLKIGKWIHYDETGEEDIVEIYENGELTSTIKKD